EAGPPPGGSGELRVAAAPSQVDVTDGTQRHTGDRHPHPPRTLVAAQCRHRQHEGQDDGPGEDPPAHEGDRAHRYLRRVDLVGRLRQGLLTSGAHPTTLARMSSPARTRDTVPGPSGGPLDSFFQISSRGSTL